MAMLDARAVRVADELGVEHIDLMSVLEPTLANYYDFFHLTPAGARTVAETVARVLVHDRGFLEAASPCVDLRAS